jgi:hypothetical protein
VDRSPAEVAKFLEDLIADTGGEWDWDDFESSGPIRDPILEAYRQKAIRLGPPDADLEGLQRILGELRAAFPNIR